MLDQFILLLQGVPAPLAVMILAMTPVIELQAAIPAAIGVYKLSMPEALFYGILGNMVPAFIVLFGWDAVMSALEARFPAFHRFMDKYHHGLHMKWQSSIDKYGPLAIVIFMAVPTPLSGVWSSSLVAWIFGIHRRAALISVFAGVVIAAFVLTFVTNTAIAVF